MDISKYCDFSLDRKHSDKKGKDYYCITLKVKNYEFPIIFLSEKKYNKIKDTLQ